MQALHSAGRLARARRMRPVVAEKVLKYLEEKSLGKDLLISKLLMKNQANKAAIRKAEVQLKSKEEGGDDLQYIDFHQLQIENQQFVLKIEEANHELIQLKRTSGRTVKMLNNMKKKLNQLMSEACFFQDEIAERGRCSRSRKPTSSRSPRKRKMPEKTTRGCGRA